MLKIGLIGTGKIGSVIVETLCRYSKIKIDLLISSRSESRSNHLKANFDNVQTSDNNQHIVDNCDIIILALRTTIALDELKKLKFKSNQKLISVVPNTNIIALKNSLNIEIPLCRLTPLPPAVHALGSILIYQPFSEIYDLFGNSGILMECANEKELHALWAISCLITPYYEVLAQIATSAIQYGASPEIAKKYTASMCAALAQTALVKSESLQELGDDAKTPGGLNELTDKLISENGGYKLFEEAFNRVMERFPKA